MPDQEGMSPNSKRMLLNLFLLALVSALVVFILTRNQEQGDKIETLYDKSMGDDVTQVVIHVKGQDDMHIENMSEKGADNNESLGWMITQPIQQKADKTRVQHLFTLLTDPVANSYDAAGKNLAKYGLDNENLTVSFNGIKLIMGNINPVSDTRYVLKGDKIYLISETVSGLLEAGVDGFKKEDVQ